MILSNSIENITLGHAGIYGLLGYAVVFLGLILLMFLVMLLGKAFLATAKKTAKKDTAPTPEVTQSVQVPSEPAPGSAGQLKLYDVEPKTAAMLMAIVANKLQKPVNELRFISIKEVTK